MPVLLWVVSLHCFQLPNTTYCYVSIEVDNRTECMSNVQMLGGSDMRDSSDRPVGEHGARRETLSCFC